jgi:hypothetical protein
MTSPQRRASKGLSLCAVRHAPCAFWVIEEESTGVWNIPLKNIPLHKLPERLTQYIFFIHQLTY